jgi:DNA-binding MarR family transcriptional regulator
MNAELRDLLDVDMVLHSPPRLLIVAILAGTESADFTYLLRETGLTRGNLSTHLSRLEEAQYITIEKTYRGKTPLTLCRITPQGQAAFQAYRQRLQHIVDCIEPAETPPGRLAEG